MPNAILTRKELNKIKCDCCGKTEQEIYFIPVCHPHSKTISIYYQGMLKIVCTRCGKNVVILEVK